MWVLFFLGRLLCRNAIGERLPSLCRHGCKKVLRSICDRDDCIQLSGCTIGLHTSDPRPAERLHRFESYLSECAQFEGVNGLEQMKWSPASVDQEVWWWFLFTRQVSGPMDYRKGRCAMPKGNYYPLQFLETDELGGTRCRQLFLYVVFESPLICCVIRRATICANRNHQDLLLTRQRGWKYRAWW